MKLSRVVAGPFLAAALCAWLPCPASAQGAPKLSKSQRAALEAVVAAVDRAQASGEATPAEWQSHVLRASDGSHYVALSAVARGVPSPKDAQLLYVRLATRRLPTAGIVPSERSAIAEWLQGLRAEPLPMQPGRSMSVPQGEMPVGGAAASSRRANESTDATSALRLLSHQQERAARERAEREAARRAELESAGGRALAMLPFEDFDVDARPAVLPDGSLEVRRAVVAGPGDFDVFMGWKSGQTKEAAVTVVRYRLTLPAAVRDFALSDVIVAAQVAPAVAAYGSNEQSAHPYAIGALDVTPAHANSLSAGGTLGLVYQVINPSASTGGKPTVEVGFRVSRVVDGRMVAFGELQTQRYDETNLPADFDAAKGHPLFGAVRASLATFPRGRYKVTVTAVDLQSAKRATAEATFDVRGTPESLLREAPAAGHAFRRDSVLVPSMLSTLANAFRPAAPSEALAGGLEAVRTGRFAELMRVDAAVPAERPIAQALLGLGLFGVGDSPRAVAAQLMQAIALGAPPAPVQLLLGATHALVGDDKAAITAWHQAREAGIDDASVAVWLIDAYLRQGDVARAGAMATAALDAQPGNLAARQALAATYIATRRPAEALALLDTAPGGADDIDTRFLRLHALFASLVVRAPAFDASTAQTRFAALAPRYVADGGRHADLVREWIAVTTDGSR